MPNPARLRLRPFLLALLGASAAAPAGRGELAAGFDAPPADTRPACYWYWLSDHVSKDGITKDVESMARLGIGEAFIGNVEQGGARGTVKLLTEPWLDAMAHAMREGHRTGVSVGMFNAPGWSQSGGPWIPPTRAMRYLTSSSVTVTGPTKFSQKIAPATRPFQDVAVLAYPAPAQDGDTLARHKPAVTCSMPTTRPADWCDDDVATTAIIGARGKGEPPVTIDLRVDQPFTARSLSLVPGPKQLDALCDLLAEADDGTMRVVETFRVQRRRAGGGGGPMPTGPFVVSFAPVSSRHFAVRLRPATAGGATGDNDLAEIRLSGGARLEAAIEKQLGRMHPTPRPAWDSYVWPTPPEPGDEALVVDRARVQNLADRLSPDGTLTWDVPPGEWIIERVGMTPTGAKNYPAPREGQGLELDKMSRAPLRDHFDAYVGRVLSRLTPAEKASVKHVIIDSYEVGSQNWTEGFGDVFEQTYGYDALPWLPVLGGRIVGSADQSERFLWDLRRLIADRIATEYVGGLRDVLASHGLRLWLENYGHWGFPSEFMKYGGQAHDIGGEFWAGGDSALGSIELKAAASTAHGYGKNEVSAEAFTGGPAFQNAPWDLKVRGDWAMAEGVNQFVLTVYIHQPYEDRKPGVNAWFGTEFNRHNTWFEQSKSWIDYLRRSQFLLKQGQYVADVAYFIGDDAPKMTGPVEPALPAGHAYDFINGELIERLTVKDGRLVLPSGMSYRLLVLPPQQSMRPELLDKLQTLIAAGAAVLGPRPTSSPSMKGYPACDEHVRRVASDVWQDTDGKAKTHARFGDGHVFSGTTVRAALDELGVGPDVSGLDAALPWIHRAGPDFDVYFISNQRNEPRDVTPSFRVAGRQPEVWNAVDATRRDLPAFAEADGRTSVPLTFGPREALFVVFAKPTATPAIASDVPAANFPALRDRQILDGPWAVRFYPHDRGPIDATFDTLTDWTRRPEPDIAHFSGTATYARRFTVADGVAGSPAWLNTGAITGIARVRLNGVDAGTIWCAPWRTEVTAALRPGENVLEIDVTNNWINRLLSDVATPQDRRATWTSGRPPNLAGVKPQPSGMLGPVTIQSR